MSSKYVKMLNTMCEKFIFTYDPNFPIYNTLAQEIGYNLTGIIYGFGSMRAFLYYLQRSPCLKPLLNLRYHKIKRKPGYLFTENAVSTLHVSPMETLPWNSATFADIRVFRLELVTWSKFWTFFLAAIWYLTSMFLVQHVRLRESHTWRSLPWETQRELHFKKMHNPDAQWVIHHSGYFIFYW